MDELDMQMAQRVWQRVQSRETPVTAAPRREDPVSLMFQSHDLAGLYLGVQRSVHGRTGEQIKKLYREHRKTVEILRGICRMTGGTVPKLPPMTAGNGTPGSILESCFRREQRLGNCFAELARGGEFGGVYGGLADWASQRQLTVLSLLGDPGF